MIYTLLKFIDYLWINSGNPWTHTKSPWIHFDRQCKPVGKLLVIWITFLNLHSQINNKQVILVWKVSSNTLLSCFIRGLQTLKNNKSLGASPLDFHCFLHVFGTPDERLKLKFELLLTQYVITWFYVTWLYIVRQKYSHLQNVSEKK